MFISHHFEILIFRIARMTIIIAKSILQNGKKNKKTPA